MQYHWILPFSSNTAINHRRVENVALPSPRHTFPRRMETERDRLVLNWGGRETQLPTLKYACMWEIFFQNKYTTKSIIYTQNSVVVWEHTHTKKMETKLISFWIFFFPSPFLQIMIKILRNLSDNIQFKNLQVFCLYCSGVKKILLSRKKEVTISQKYYTTEYGILEQTFTTTATDVFIFSTSINCNTNEHWLLWKMHNIHTI